MQRKQWTKEELETLVKCYPTCTMEELVILLGVSRKKIRAQASRLKLKKTLEFRKHIHRTIGMRNRHTMYTGHTMYTDEAQQKKSSSLAKMIKAERLRIKYGFPRKKKTRLTIFTPREIRDNARKRYYLRSKGYIVNCDNKIVYYNKQTKRSEQVEKRYSKHGYTFAEVGQDVEIKSYDPEPCPYSIII
jgi:hypothetical protein